MKKVIIAFDSFKGSLTSREAGDAAAQGVASAGAGWESEVVSIADGGEGTVEALVDALDGRIACARVPGPLGEPVEARYGICGDTAVLEISSACGLTLIPKEARNPEKTSTYGVGMLIQDAMDKGCRKFKIGLGGSATNDAGVGMLRALGFRFLDSAGNEIGDNGGEVGRIVSIDFAQKDPRLSQCEFIIACDVTNPLCGPDGASLIFGGQKGADSDMQKRLDDSLKSFAEVVKLSIGKDCSAVPGAGAAGGLGFAFIAFLGACLVPGIDMVLDAVAFDSRLRNVNLVITGEGKIDRQTCMGKAPSGVLRRALRAGVPVIAVGGAIDIPAVPELLKSGFKAIFDIAPGPISLEESMRPEVARMNLERTIFQLFRII